MQNFCECFAFIAEVWGSNPLVSTNLVHALPMEIEQKYLLKLKELVVNFLKDREVKVILFGSRARGEGLPFSDVDIGIIPSGELSDKELAILRERIEDSNIPYKVEVINFSEVSEGFKESALKEAIVWKD